MMEADLRVRLADGTEVGYAEAGDPGGRPVLHLHGTPGSRLEVGLPAARRAAEDLGVRLIGLDRPGVGLSPHRHFSIRDYPQLLRGFTTALGLERFAVTGVSSGGKYACACAWGLPDLVTGAVLASSTCSFDLPGARATWSREDRLMYTLASRAPWLLRLMYAKLVHDVRRDPAAIFPLMKGLGPADQDILAREDFRQAFATNAAEAFRQGSRGPAHDYTLEARPWDVPLGQIRVPIHIWHGQDDRLVSPQQSQILAAALPGATTHFVPGQGHLLLAGDHAKAALQSAVSS
jgi:pimeloyl-ACP methyl ester carboxylesterase